MHRGKHGDDVSGGLAPFRVQHRDLPLCGRFVNVSVFESSSQRPRVELDVELKTLADQLDQAGIGCVSSNIVLLKLVPAMMATLQVVVDGAFSVGARVSCIGIKSAHFGFFVLS